MNMVALGRVVLTRREHVIALETRGQGVGHCWMMVVRLTSSVARTPMVFQWRTSAAFSNG
jgi:non-homologous end joining protein Ku